MPRISSLYTDLKSLINLQEGIANALDSEIQSIRAEKGVTSRELEAAVKALVPAGDMQRYQELTKASQEAGATFDCAALVEEWAQKDEENRQERAALEGRWGTRHDVEQTEAVRKEQLAAVTQALDETVTEIDAFDETTAKIEAHNTKYPKSAITEENHDGYETTSLWKRIGYYLWFNRGPHDAYLAIGEYTKEFDVDYYEQANEIKAMRDNRPVLEQKKADAQASYDEIDTVGKRMDELDNSYRGPDGIARGIRSMISDFLVQDDDFAIILNDHLKVREATDAALCVAKIRVFEDMANKLVRPYKNAKGTLGDLSEPLKTLGPETGEYLADLHSPRPDP